MLGSPPICVNLSSNRNPAMRSCESWRKGLTILIRHTLLRQVQLRPSVSKTRSSHVTPRRNCWSDLIYGGVKVNALPEAVYAIANHRIADHRYVVCVFMQANIHTLVCQFCFRTSRPICGHPRTCCGKVQHVTGCIWHGSGPRGAYVGSDQAL
jgi:hypothetical protein